MAFIKKFLTIIFSILFSLFLIEIYLYWDNYRPQYKKYSTNIGSFEYTTNDSIKLSSSTESNFIVLGDSFTHAEVCASKKKDFVNILKNKFNDYNIYNFGINGGSPIHYVNILQSLDKTKIKKLLLVLYYNDIDLTLRNCKLYKSLKDKLYYYPKECEFILQQKVDSQNDTTFKKIDNFFETKLLVWSLLKEGLANITFFKGLYNRSGWENKFQNTNTEEFLAIINDLKYIKDTMEKENISLTITYFPDVHYLRKDYPRAKVWKNFILNAEDYNLKIYDPWNFFIKNSKSKNMSWSLVDKHANCDANKIMADYLLTIL